jgi:plasmid stabilization system protein ParE
MQDFEVVWTPTATLRFNEIIDYLEINFSIEISNKFATKVFKINDLLAKMPMMGSINLHRENVRKIIIS